MSKVPRHNMFKKERGEFSKAVEKAFKDSRYPGDDYIIYKDGLHFDDGKKLYKSFKGKDWKNISLETLILNRDHIPFFTPIAFHFYLPAFLIASVTYFEQVDVLKNNTLYSLTPPKDAEEGKMFSQYVVLFTNEQKSVIKEFLRIYAELSPSSLMLDPNEYLKRAIEFWEGNTSIRK